MKKLNNDLKLGVRKELGLWRREDIQVGGKV